MSRRETPFETSAEETDAPRQVAALCARHKAGRVEVLMITSRTTRRWILPKGWVMAGKSAAEAALIEAWEEAGVIGSVSDRAIGAYEYPKLLGTGKALLCRVEIYPVRVEKLAQHYPEKAERRRKWMPAKKAAKQVAEPDLAKILRALVL